MFFPRKFGLRHKAQQPHPSARASNPNNVLRPDFKLSQLELMALLLLR